MGLLRAGEAALSTVLADQWREYFYCSSLPDEILLTKGEKRVGKKSSNTKGSDNIISNGSIIAVNVGQCMIIVDQGKIAEVCAEPGEFIYDSSTEPSIFYGGLGSGIKESFNTLGKRFTFGGDTAKDQRVYFINTKEIKGNKYGTPAPVPFRVVDNNIGLDIDISIRCNGEYSYQICDPVLFYTNVCANVVGSYSRANIDSILKNELMTSLQPTFAKISAMGIRYSALPGETEKIAETLNTVLSAKWRELRGIKVVSFGIKSVTASEEDEAMIKELQRNATFRNPTMAAAQMVGAQSQAIQDAAKNNNGAMAGIMGMGMVQNIGGGMANAANLFAMGNQNNAPQPTQNTDGWTCSCGATNTGKFCVECGKQKAVSGGWVCKCGAVNKGKFCSECGNPKPANEPLYKCDKCGWEPDDPKNPPKFCPECGDVFDENDIQ